MTTRIRHPGTTAYLPDAKKDLAAFATAVQRCQGCDLYADATQAVFGQGPAHARLLLVGEQPGDVEDREGEPFVGPAGHLLRDALQEIGLNPADVYLTNAVKHFRFKRAERGKRRIHESPTRGEIVACRPWLEAEVAAVDPFVVVALGATAMNSMFGPSARLTASRGQQLEWEGRLAVATIHPSAVLRAPDAAQRAEAYQGFLDDLAFATSLLGH